jgi:hypothetical protein
MLDWFFPELIEIGDNTVGTDAMLLTLIPARALAQRPRGRREQCAGARPIDPARGRAHRQPTCPATLVFLGWFVLAGWAEPIILTFGVVDLAATAWTPSRCAPTVPPLGPSRCADKSAAVEAATWPGAVLAIGRAAASVRMPRPLRLES